MNSETLEHRRMLSAITVDEMGDTSVAGHFTLRDAIAKADSDPAGDVINFANNVTGTITLTQGVITISNSITITGPGAGVLTVSGGGASQIFSVTDGSATTTQNVGISGLTLAQGAGGTKNGGAIDNFENLTLSNDVITQNTSSVGAGVCNEAAATLTSSNDTFSNNTSTTTGGGIDNAGILKSTSDTISNNKSVNGGGINNEKTGVLTTHLDQFLGNSVSAPTGAFGGGGLNNLSGGAVTSTGDTFTSNTAVGNSLGAGGAIQNAGTMTIAGAVVTLSQADIGGAVEAISSFTSSGSTFSNNHATVQGGAIDVPAKQTFSSTTDTFSGNSTAGNGGGIENAGTVLLVNGTISGNTAVLGGGFDNESVLTSSGSTFSGNTATNAGGVNNPGTWTSTNDTVSGNSATTAGGGIDSAGTLITVNDTIAGNVNSGVTITAKTWTSQSSIIAGNTLASNAASDVVTTGGTITAADTLVGNAASAGGILNGITGNIVGVTTNTIFATSGGVPLLANNGGPTKTIALISGSPAIAAGGSITTVTAAVAQSAAPTVLVVGSSADIVVGDFLRIDNEIVQVTVVTDATHITVNRGMFNTTPAAHLINASVNMGVDQRGYARGLVDIGSYAIKRTIVVTIAGDTETLGFITLRDAVNEADIETPNDTINFAANVTSASLLNQGDIVISNAMTIAGPGLLDYSGNNVSRVFDIEAATLPTFNVTISGLGISEGNGVGNHSGLGGAIYNAENLTLSNNQFNSDVSTSGAAVYNAGTLTSSSNVYRLNSATNDGGAITNTLALTSTDDNFTADHATMGGAINNAGGATAVTSGDTFDDVGATYGGATDNSGVLMSTDDLFLNNNASGTGGALLNATSGTATIVSDTFTSNSAFVDGGLGNYGTLTSLDSTYNQNSATNAGGGLGNHNLLTSTNDTFFQNSAAGGGGGIYNSSMLTTTNDTITDNTNSGVDNVGFWNTTNTIIAGNLLTTGSTSPSDINGLANFAFENLIGDTGTAGGLTNGVNGNIVGKPANTIFVTDTQGTPVLTNNGGPTETILLAAGSRALAAGGFLAIATAPIANSAAPTTIMVNSTTFIAAGDFLRIDNEIVLVTSVTDSTHVIVSRGQDGTAIASHLVNALIGLGKDARGFARGVNDLGAVSAPRKIVVTIGGDAEVTGQTTLRDAVNDANIEVPGDTVTFANNVTGTITLTQGELPVTNAYAITGPGALVLTVSGNNARRIFDVSSTSASTFAVTITGLTLSKGNAGSSANHTGLGGAIFNSENLTLSNDTFSSNTATTGGGIDNSGTLTITSDKFSSNSATTGGGVGNSGTLNSSNNTFSSNSATDGGGLGNSGTATSTNDTMSGNSATDGGAFYNSKTLMLNLDSISGNSAVSGGGAYNIGTGTLTDNSNSFTNNTATQAAGGSGGGIANLSGGVVNSTSDVFTTNSATGSGANSSSGGGVNNAGTMTISGVLFIDNSATSGGAIENSGGLTSSNVQFKTNVASTKGGGIDNRGTVTSSTDLFEGNTAPNGGGLSNSAGTFQTTTDQFSGNSATTGGGGILNSATLNISQDNLVANTASSGGGLENQSTGTVNSSNNMFTGNTASATTGGSGGGLYNVALGVVNSSNDTFQGNSASGGNLGSGGGVFNAGMLSITTDVLSTNVADLGGALDNTGTLVSLFTTYSGNTATGSGGGIANGGSGQIGALSSSYDTYSGNTATDGGGLFTNGDTLKLLNDTIAENTATEGGGIFNRAGTVNTVNVTIANNSADVSGGLGGGFANAGAATWNAISTIDAGNHQGSPVIPSDFVAVSPGGTVAATDSLFGDAATDDGIQGGANGNIAGKATNTIFVTDTGGIPILASNGGPTQTIALLPGSPAIGQGSTTLTTVTTLVPPTGATGTIQVASTADISVGDFLRIDREVFRVTTVLNATSILVARAQKGTSTALHTAGSAVSVADDQRGFSRGVNDIGAFEPVRTITVDVSGDTEIAGHTTLRDAVTEADAEAPGDTIVFGPLVLGTISLTQGELPITTAMTIDGTGANLLTVSAKNTSRIFDINATSQFSVTISGLTLSQGNSDSSSSNTGLGGAIFNNQALTLSNDNFTSNTANSGGAIDNQGTLTTSNDSFSNNSATSGNGGGILNSGDITSAEDTFTSNTASNSGGGLFAGGQVGLTSDVFTGNTAGQGGGVDNTGNLSSSDTTYNGNTATSLGGGIDNGGVWQSSTDTFFGNSAGIGGGAFNFGTLTMTNDTIALNTAANGGGIANTQIFNSIDVTIAGNTGSGIDNLGTWNSLNTIVDGNLLAAGSMTASDVVNSGTINATFTLIGDVSSAGGISNGVSGNIVGAALNTVLATDVNGRPLLANNGGPTKTIAMLANAPGSAQGGPLASANAAITLSNSPTTVTVNSSQNIVTGDLLRIDNEIVAVTTVDDPTHITVQRGLDGTMPAAHAANAPLTLAIDQRGDVRGVTGMGAVAAPRTITVDQTGDTEAPGQITLRDAVSMADAEGPGDIIAFAPNVTGIISLSQGELPITNPTAIIGPGAGVLTVSGNGASRIFYINSALSSSNAVTISGLTLSQGNSNSNSDNAGLGGAIFNTENLTLFNDIFTGNVAQAKGPGGGGAVFNGGILTSTNDVYATNTAKDGGAIYNNSGIVTSSLDTFTGNTASNTGGAIGNVAELFITSDTFSGNSAPNGGAINSTDKLIAQGDTFTGNTAITLGGGILNDGSAISTNETFVGNSGLDGGGLFNEGGSLTTVNDSITNNSGNGVFQLQGTWNSLNTIIAGNVLGSGSTNKSDVVHSGGTINASNTLIGDANSAGGIVNGTNGNIVGKATNTIFVTDSNGHPLLASHGGPTQTIALAAGSPAIGQGGPMATVTAVISQSTAPTTVTVNSSIHFAIGDLVKIDNEIVLVTAVLDATHIAINRAQAGTSAAAHLANAPINIANDQSGAIRSSIDLGSLANVNHAPSGTSGTVGTITNTPYTFKVADFGFTDPGDMPPNTLLNVEFTLLPNAGVLTDNGVPVTVNQFVSAVDINAGKLVFTPNTNLVGGPYFLCKFQVQDNGGTANGGVDLDPTAKILDIRITHLDHAPVGTPNTVTTLKNIPYAFKIADFGFTDPNDTPHDSLLAVKITTLPAVGSLTDNGVAVVAGTSVSASDISGGKLIFTPGANGTGAAYASLTFQVQDNGGTVNNGVDTDQTPRKMTISVISVNHAPVGTSGTVTGHVNAPYVVQTANFGFTDPNNTPPNTLLAVKITILPNAGTLTDNGVAVVAGQFVSALDISSGKLVFTPKANLSGGPYFMCQFQVQNNGGTANGGVDLDPNPKVLDIKILP